MIDINILLRNWLLESSDLTTALGGTRVYCIDLPEKFDPAEGCGLVIAPRGGTADTDIPFISPRIQLTAWAGVEQYQQARAVYRAAFDWLHQKNNIDRSPDGFVLSSLEITQGQDVTDPEMGWATVVSFFQIVARANS